MGMATIPVIGDHLKQFEEIKDVPKYIMDCPVYYNWCEFKGETYFGILNYERSLKAKRPMIDLAYCATQGMNGTILKTVQYTKRHFAKSKLDTKINRL